MEPQETLAIIKEVGFGMRDGLKPMLWFTTYLSENTAALQCFTDPNEYEAIIKDADVYDVRKLDGRPCWVVRDNGIMRFRRIAKI